MLNSYIDNTVYRMSQIEGWLNENWERYRDSIDGWQCKNCPTEQGLPCICAEPDDEWKFFKLYEALDKLNIKHKREKYFEQEMSAYKDIQYSEKDLKIWTAKNEKLGFKEYIGFKSDYLEYESENEATKHLRVTDAGLSLMVINVLRAQLGRTPPKVTPDFEVFVNRNDFRYTLEFIDVFHELFWNREILPESIERLNREMEQNRKISLKRFKRPS